MWAAGHSSNLTTLLTHITVDIAYKKLLKMLLGMCVFMLQNSYYMYKTVLLQHFTCKRPKNISLLVVVVDMEQCNYAYTRNTTSEVENITR